MINSRIGVFDSGVGGLAVWNSITRKLPSLETVYLADQKYLPYGEKSDREIVKRAMKISEFLINQRCSLVVVACNTATVSAIRTLRKTFPVPFVGVEPAVKPAARESRSAQVTVLGTSKTVASKRHQKLLREHAPNTTIRLFDAPEFVALVEQGEIHSPRTLKKIKSFFATHDIGLSDVLVLACTHYIFLKEPIKSILPRRISVLEPSQAVAARVGSLVNRRGMRKGKDASRHRFLTTADPRAFTDVAEKLLQREMEPARHVVI